MLQVYGLVNALQLSDTHCSFSRTHLTYSPNPEIFNLKGTEDSEIHLLYKVLDGVPTNDAMPTTLKDFTIEVVKWLFTESMGGELTTNLEASNLAIATRFNTNDIHITLGTTRADSNNRILPEWVNIEHFGDVVRLWLLPTAIESQYEYRQYIVADPITDKDEFVTSNLSTLTTLLKPYVDNPTDAINSVVTVRPCTKLAQITSTWNNKDNKVEELDVTFTVAMYGPGSTNDEELRNALREYLLEGSAHTALIWESVFPELFSISTFTLIPNFDRQVEGSLPPRYSPIFDHAYHAKLMATDLMDQDTDNISKYLEVIPTVYQSVACSAMPASGNLENAKTLNAFYDDYILASNRDGAFINMDETTRKFVIKLLDALPVAVGDSNELPNGISYEYANSLKYVSFTVADCHIRILMRAGYESVKAQVSS